MRRVVSPVVGMGLVMGFFLVGFLPAPGQTTKTSERSAGKRLALVVGVNKYKHAKLDPLEFAERDAEKLAELLANQGYQVVLMTPGEGEKNAERMPTKANIDSALERLMRNVGRDDQIVVGLAGHGIQPDGSADCFYCPQDANPTIEPGKGGEPARAARSDTLLAITGPKGLIQTLDDSGVGRKLIFIDACRNDTSSGRGRGLGSQIVALPANTYVMLSCSARERSFETKKLGGGHGAFFHFVLQGLRGAAVNEQGVVTWNRLAEYVYDNVSASVPDVMGGGAEQHPNELKNGVASVAVLTAKMGTKPSTKPAAAAAAALALAPFDTTAAKKFQDDWARALGVPAEITNSINMRLRLIPAGTFLMGSPTGETDREEDESPQHRVTISRPFYLGIFEVTQRQYQQVMGTNPSWFSATGGGSEWVAGMDTADFPVEDVSWDDAQQFCLKLSALAGERQAGRQYRLPTEAEWEYACRAGTNTPFHFGTSNNGSAANVDGRYPYGTPTKGPFLGRTAKSGSYAPNAFGLFDMHGNVWEWCQDWYDEKYYEQRVELDPQGPGSSSENRRVLRGGSWLDIPRDTRSSDRNWDSPDNRYNLVGFRVVCSSLP